MSDTAKLIIGILVMIGLLFGIIGLFTIARPKVHLESEEYTLMHGDTLWDIAEEHCPNEMDLREYINKVEQLNGITADIRAGDTIMILVEAD